MTEPTFPPGATAWELKIQEIAARNTERRRWAIMDLTTAQVRDALRDCDELLSVFSDSRRAGLKRAAEIAQARIKEIEQGMIPTGFAPPIMNPDEAYVSKAALREIKRRILAEAGEG